MKKIKETFLAMFRDNNKTTWIPLAGSFALTFLTPLVDIIVPTNPKFVIITSIVGIVSGIVFIALVYKYMQHMHSIWEVLRSGKGLLKTCAYLAALRNNKYWNNYQLRSMDVRYTFSDPVYNDSNVPTYPFSVEYIINGQATTNMTSVVYHTIGPVFDVKGILLEYAFDNDSYRAIEENNKLQEAKVLSFYKLISCKRYRSGDLFTYKIRLSFDGTHGLKAKDLRRILFHCRNVTENCSGITASVELSAPFSFKSDFNSPLFIQYENGLNQAPNSSDLRLNHKSEYEHGKEVFSTKLQLDPDSLFVLELTGKTN